MYLKSGSFFVRSMLAATLLAGAAALPTVAAETVDLSSLAAATEPPLFDTPEAAVDAFKAALATDNGMPLANLLGLDGTKLLADENAVSTFEAIREGAKKQLIVEDIRPGRKALEIGTKLWELPFPLVKGDDGKWAFDTFAGLEEITNRRVGENELQTLATVQAYVDAQQEYASEDRDDDGVLEFAQKLVSTEGTHDGLYWPDDETGEDSPAGDLDQEQLSGAAEGNGYFGYKYRILKGQGDQIAGGAYDYVINGNMIAGFALVAWPVKYGETGVQTFLVNQQGTVYEADLGPATPDIVEYIERFNPDDSWKVVDD
jgi:hypothetical protein